MELFGTPVPDNAMLPAIFAMLASFGLFALHPCLVSWNIYKKEHVQLQLFPMITCGLYTFMLYTYFIIEDLKHGEIPTSEFHVNLIVLNTFITTPFFGGAYAVYGLRFEGAQGVIVVVSRAGTIILYLFIVSLAAFPPVANNFGVIFVVFGSIMYASPMSLIMSIYRGGDVADYLPSWLCISFLLHSIAWLVLAWTVLDINFYCNVGEG